MPLYYNTGAPAGGNSNSIKITATDLGLRDFLLSRNIQNPIRYPQLSTSINGGPRGGEPVLDTMVGGGVIIPHVPIEVDGLIRYSIAILPNHYKDMDPAAPILLSINTVLASHPTGYPISPSGTLNYSQEDYAKFGVGGISNYYEFRKKATLRNLYVDATKQIDMADLISLQPIQTNKQLPSYDQAWGQLAGSQGVTEAVNVIGSVLNGQGVGIGNGGLETNFDIRSSLAGRVLGAVGLLNDTKLGIIGGQQLALALANNAAFNVEQEILGALNISDNILSLVKNGTLAGFRPNYKITVSNTLGGQLIGLGEKILGFQVPRSYLQDDGSIFSNENKYIENIARANKMIENTGKGQVEALKANVNANIENIQGPFRSGYVPGFLDKKGNKFNNEIKGYAFMNPQGNLTTNFLVPTDGVIPDLNWNREELVENSGFRMPSNTNIDIVFVPNLNGSLIAAPLANNLTDTYGNGVTHINKPTFSWVASNSTGSTKPVNATPLHIGGSGDKKSLLGKTQMLFNSKGMRNLVSVKGDMTIGYGSQLQTSVVNGGISKGSAVLKGNLFDANGNITTANNQAENTFCRSWTTFDRYDKVYKLIRNRGLNESEAGFDSKGKPIFPEGNKWRLNTKGSVLDDNGFVKIVPYKTDDLTRQASDPKKYMFSIENLAWAGSPAVNLLPVEQGPGDLLTGKFGRIMWFPPYDLTFSESNNVSLETTSFIGRGEPIYTYNNTERTGTLSFKIIMDHPSIMNAFKGPAGPTDEYIRSWYAGCLELDPKWANLLTKEEKEKIETRKEKKVTHTVVKAAKAPDDINIYFPNDVTKIDTIINGADKKTDPPNGINGGYEFVIGKGIGDYNGEIQYRSASLTDFHNSPEAVPYSRQVKNKGDGLKLWPDDKAYGLNGPANKLAINGKDYTNPEGWRSANYIADLKAYLNPANPKDGCPKCRAVCTGFASGQGTGYANEQLNKHRAESMQKWLIDNDILPANRIYIDPKGSRTLSGKYNAETPVDQKDVKIDRYGAIKFVNEIKDAEVDVETYIYVPVEIALIQQIKRRFYNEADFFEKLKITDPLVFDTLKQKIRYFDPAFHSMTPEGFNSRLTFLLQCTRQGPTIADSGAANLAFGPQPVCILRIGDFYNTKIMMDNLSIDYEPLVWDLNPEGVGVQPMIANVTISFKYIGGSSLYSPINKLQNALSFNYFANTQVYDPRADYVAKDGNETRPTFPYKTKEEAQKVGVKPEPNYILMTGLDSTKTSMGALHPNEISKTEASKNNTNNPNQVAGSNAATSTANSPAGQTEMARIKLTDVQSSVANWGQYAGASFTISRTDTTDNKSLNANYDLTVNIKGKELTSDIFTIKLPKQLDGATLGGQNFSFDLANMTPSCSGLTLTSSSYTFEVAVGTIGSLNAVIDKISGGTTATTATTTTSTTAGDEVIFDNASLLHNYALFNLKIGSDDKLTGRFAITSEYDLLKADHAAKLSVMTEMGPLVELASFTIDGTYKENKILGGGNFTTKNGNMRSVIDLAKKRLDNGTNYIPFVVTIPEFPNLRFFDGSRGLAEFDCPDEDIKFYDIIKVREMETILRNYCKNCYPNGTGGKKIIVNGVSCSTTGATNTPTGTYEISKSGSKTTSSCDPAHNFRELTDAINNAQMDLYNKNVNPKITKLNIKISKNGGTYLQEWDFTIGKSTDGKAWTGFDSRGSCGSGYIGRADDQYLGRGEPGQGPGPCFKVSLADCLKNSTTTNAVDVELVATYQNDTDQFKQYFVQFTKSTNPAK
jgi:hypothetical protein